MRTDTATEFDEQMSRVHVALLQAVRDWLTSVGASIADLRVVPFTAPGGPGVEVIPKNRRAASAFFRLETPVEMVLHLGRNSWWDQLPPERELVHRILDAVSQGKFKETLRVCCGRVMTSHGQLQLSDATWNDRGLGVPVGRVRVEEYEPFDSSSQ